MAKKEKKGRVYQERPPKANLSAEESLKRMQEIDKRKEAMIAAVRKGKDRSVSA
jgi:hypothetical protein